jgi:hypothetical protein
MILMIFVWGHMRQLVYAEPVVSEEYLGLRIEDASRIIREMPFGMAFLIASESWRRRRRTVG